jgi:hypothetical protein
MQSQHLAKLVVVLAGLCTGPVVGAQDEGAPSAQTGQAAGTAGGQGASAAKAQPKVKPGKQAAEPARPQRKPPPRRHVWQVVGPEPLVNLGPVYSPTLTPRPPTTPMPAPIPGTSQVQPGPAPLNSCAGSLCTDASGSQYNIGVGNAGTDSQGRLCNRVGNTVQCF